jgi:hypothetical protein
MKGANVRQLNSEWQGTLSDLIDLGLAATINWLKEQARIAGDPSIDNQADEDPEAIEAASVLGVSVDAPPDEIRAALRRKITARAIHPDQGGDGEEAARLIAAKNLLLDRWREAA